MIYLDYNSTFRPDFAALEGAVKQYKEHWGNASGLSAFSQASKHAVENVHATVEKFFSIPAKSFTFTSSGTEAIYSLVHGYLKALPNPHRRIVTSPIEHPAMEEALWAFSKDGYEIIELPVKSDGQINPAGLPEMLQRGVDLVSCILVQNETGVIQPLEAILDIRDDYIKNSTNRPVVPVFSDTIQGVGKIDFPYARLDGFTLAGHKIGAGILSSGFYCNPALATRPLFTGGSQEYGRRAGTESLLGIYSIGKIVKNWQSNPEYIGQTYSRLAQLRDKMEERLQKLPYVVGIAGQTAPRTGNTSFVLLKDIQLDFLLMYLDSAGVYISTGTSCKSQARTASKVLLAMGYSEEQAQNRIRISLGPDTTGAEIDAFIDHLERFGAGEMPVTESS